METNRIRTIIVDDDERNWNLVNNIVTQYCQDVEVVDIATTIDDAFEKINKGQPQLVLLDIELGLGNAFDLLKKFKQINFHIIFITAFKQYAIEAFEYAAYDYLLKPIDIVRLQQAIERVKNATHLEEMKTKLKLLQEIIDLQGTDYKKILLQSTKGQLYLQYNEIVFFEANGTYSNVYLTNGAVYQIVNQLGEIEIKLTPNIFMRTHHSYIINCNEIATYQKARSGVVVFKNGMKAMVASRKRKDFEEKLKEFIG